MLLRLLIFVFVLASAAFSQMPPVEPGVSHDLAKWRAARYSDIRYKLNLTLEKMSPVLKGTIEIRVKVEEEKRNGGEKETAARVSEPGAVATGFLPPIILDWRKIAGHEKDSTISSVTINGKAVHGDPLNIYVIDEADPDPSYTYYHEHLVFNYGVVAGENIIKLDFTSPILTSGSAITRYVDKVDGAEYIYSLFVPSDASTAFPVFDQPDLKARFSLSARSPKDWSIVSNVQVFARMVQIPGGTNTVQDYADYVFMETKPISTYVFAFAAGTWERVSSPSVSAGATQQQSNAAPSLTVGLPTPETSIYVRKSQAEKFKPHAAEVFRLTREGVKYLETYFDYKFPWPKYDLVLIPEFPFGGMEHAGATFLREASVIFPTEPTKSDYISRAVLIFHETAHQWFGDTVTMKWFDDLWLKEGFAEFMAYKTLERVMPEANAWKVFYERIKQAAYLTDSTKGTTSIYQEIANLSAAKSAYGNIVYRKAPSFLRQAEFYLGEDKFQTAVRAFLRKHEFDNAGWKDLVKEFETASGQDLKVWANQWVKQPGMPRFRVTLKQDDGFLDAVIDQNDVLNRGQKWIVGFNVLTSDQFVRSKIAAGMDEGRYSFEFDITSAHSFVNTKFVFPNYQDYGYGIFLLDDKSRDYVLKNIGSEKDPFLRSMMWGSLWDSVREAELDPKDYVELVIRNLTTTPSASRPPLLNKEGSLRKSTTPPAKAATPPKQGGELDETIVSSILGRVGTAMNYYVSTAQAAALAPRLENVMLDRLQHAPTAGQRITFYRAFVSMASTVKGRDVLKQMLAQGSSENHPVGETPPPLLRKEGSQNAVPLRTKDRFDIVTRLMILGDPEASKLLANLEKTETSDDAKRYAYATKAGSATAENKAKFWNDFLSNKDISESWIEAAMVPFNSVRHSDLTVPYLEKALAELPNLKRNRKIFFVNGWLGAFIGGQRSEAALAIVNKFLADNPNLDNDLRLKILENVDLIERAVKIRGKYGKM